MEFGGGLWFFVVASDNANFEVGGRRHFFQNQKEMNDEDIEALHPMWQVMSNTKIYVKDQQREKYYLIEVVDLIEKNDPRLFQALQEQPQAHVNKRGLKLDFCPARKKLLQQQPSKITQGSWIRVHYPGWGVKYDEWVCFCNLGMICVKLTMKSECHCMRHPPALKPAAKIKLSAGVTLTNRSDLSPAFWKRVKMLSDEQKRVEI